MKDYLQQYRLLNCWECFYAMGKMCTSDNIYPDGQGICCKPNATHKKCTSFGNQECSQPVAIHDTNEKYAGVLTDKVYNM